MSIFERRESNVRSYCRTFPVVFEKAREAFVYDRDGKRYIDFFCGAGTMNYGHNNQRMKRAVIDYLEADGIMHSLDMYTAAKEAYLESLDETILTPRGMDYKVQFVAPSGANAIEAALKLVRMATRRSGIVTFTNGYHGLSSGALSVTGNSFYRREAYVNRRDVAFVPFEGYYGPGVDTLDGFEKMLTDPGSGMGHPAAVVCETIQAEGGVRVASTEWMQRLERICRQHGMLLVIDDVQVGNGRTGSYFSFEEMGIKPDIVAFSKAVSGFGLPMAMLFLKPEHDIWEPGEHTGTFRGNNLAFVAARESLRYWEDDSFAASIRSLGERMNERLAAIAGEFDSIRMDIRGRGMIWGLDVHDNALARSFATEAFKNGLMIELCGSRSNVLKFLPPLTIEAGVLEEGFDILRSSIKAALQSGAASSPKTNIIKIDTGTGA